MAIPSEAIFSGFFGVDGSIWPKTREIFPAIKMRDQNLAVCHQIA
jgi:hypothetical protein